MWYFVCELDLESELEIGIKLRTKARLFSKLNVGVHKNINE